MSENSTQDSGNQTDPLATEKINQVISALETQRNRAFSENANLMAELNMAKNILVQTQTAFKELEAKYEDLKQRLEANETGQAPEA